MTRREFTKLASSAAIAAGASLPACGPTSTVLRPDTLLDHPLDGAPLRDALLAHAALAPSSHNTQPWRVHVESPTRWIVGPDPLRQLTAVDPEARELVLSVGAFLESLVTAANALGIATDVEVVGTARTGSGMMAVNLTPSRPGNSADLERIRTRRTIRDGLRPDPIRSADVAALLATSGVHSVFFPSGSREARWLVDSELAAFTQQTWRDDAQKELSRWFRFSEADVEKHRDGLTLASMQVGGLAGWFAAHFMDAGSVMGKSFREKGIASASRQVASCGGWLVVTAPDESVPALLDAGRRFARVAIGLRERKLAAPPMSQTMEEEPWKRQLVKELGLPGIPTFVLRVGYVDDYPDPVSPRRALPSFVT